MGSGIRIISEFVHEYVSSGRETKIQTSKTFVRTVDSEKAEDELSGKSFVTLTALSLAEINTNYSS